MTRRSLKLLHTSDLHIGSDIYPEDALHGFEQVLRLAVDRSVDAVIVAGDLFDNRGVAPELVGDVFRRFGALDRPVLVLPGNHDTALMNGSFDPRRLPDGVHIMLKRGGETVHPEPLGLSVWGDPVYDHSPAVHPMGGLHPRSSEVWYIWIAHARHPERDRVRPQEPRPLPARGRHAGALCLGAYTPEAVGDYIAGPNHTLPTGATARFFSPLSVWTFYKTCHTIEATQSGLERHAEDIALMAEAEGLAGHAESVRLRVKSVKSPNLHQ